MKRKNRWRLQRVKRNLNVLGSVRSHKRLQGLKWSHEVLENLLLLKEETYF